MADKARQWTDAELERMENHLANIYSRAYKEVKVSWNDFLEDAKEEADKLLEAVNNAVDNEEKKKAKRAYQKFLREKTLKNQYYKDLVEEITGQILNINQTALDYINGKLPDIYVVNYNAIVPSVENIIDGYSFNLVDANTIRNLATKDDTLLPYKTMDGKKDVRWNTKKINAEVLQGILQGEEIPKIAKRLEKVMDMNEAAAIRNARTTVTSAECKGRQDSYIKATNDGIILKRRWIATKDNRTRHWHADLDGVEVNVDEPFVNDVGEIMQPGDPHADPANVYNCFLGETKVASDSNVVRSYKHKYDGKIISIKTASGVQFSCTPNHPILTPNGWVATELLNNGDNILVTFGEQNVFGGVNPDIKHSFPRIDAIHNLFNVSGGKRAVGVSVDFHGDVATSNVEIVTQERLLWNIGDSSGRNGIDKFLLKLSNKTLSRFGSLFKHFWSICKTSFGFIGCKCKSLPFFKCSFSHSCEHGFGTIANRDSVLTEYSINDLPADTVIDGELLDRLSCKVFLDTIVNVDVSVLSTHVYNLQTENGYYFVNSIIPHKEEKSNGIFAIAKNCRCTITAKVLGFRKVQK